MAVGWKGCWGCIYRLLETISPPSLAFKEVEFKRGEVDAPRSLATLELNHLRVRPHMWVRVP